jgi:hypothetical protein
MTTTIFDPQDLETKVKAMYRRVAENPHGEFHFEMGRALAERLGYTPADLNRILIVRPAILDGDVVGLPWARAAFSIAAYTLLPFGYKAVPRGRWSPSGVS